jgi:hypothetical protein
MSRFMPKQRFEEENLLQIWSRRKLIVSSYV